MSLWNYPLVGPEMYHFWGVSNNLLPCDCLPARNSVLSVFFSINNVIGGKDYECSYR